MVSIQQKLEMIRNGEMKAEDNISGFLEAIKKKNKEINAFLYIHKTAINEARALDKKIREKGKVGKLAGLAIAVKANISVKGMPISCGSQTLKNYQGTFDADVIEKIKAEDGIIIGITNCDEFGCGSSGENSAFGATDNPACLGKIPGGSSSGSAAAVAGDMCDIALGSDTGGSIRNPASHCGIVGLKPSYGRVSRYGLIDLAMSLDQIGPLCKEVYGAALMMEVISGKSDHDPTTYDKPILNYTQFKTPKEITIGVPAWSKELCKDQEILELIDLTIIRLAKELGIEPKKIKLKYIDLAIQTYYPLVYVEFFSATRKFDGRRYGKKIEEACGEEVLRRLLGGETISAAEYEGRYYRKALEVRELIKKSFREAFEEVDVLLDITVPSLPHSLGTKIEDPKVMYAYDVFTVPANLAGICAGVVKAGEIRGVPVGLQVMADAFREDLIFNIMKVQEDLGRKK
ncbi:Asp-tRNA(Asn)/Glu-tRNA(Gln) amidotransferase subunit GatA [Candidatus Woesearchaeota archaeon]|nr:Asp-tRNA(Asn)/Glu-tRNA(Gln) amidotransferase subunit GatA [Candidatus Woesearchaeota archaeon]